MSTSASIKVKDISSSVTPSSADVSYEVLIITQADSNNEGTQQTHKYKH